MNQLTQLPPLPELEARVHALRAQLPAHLQARPRPPRASGGVVKSGALMDESLKAQLLTLEGLRVEALLLLEQAGLSRSQAERSLSSDLSEQVTEELLAVRAASASPAAVTEEPLEHESSADFLEELESYVSPLEEMERELAELSAAQEEPVRDPLEEALSARATDRASTPPEEAPVREASLVLAQELEEQVAQRAEQAPTRRVEPAPPAPEEPDEGAVEPLGAELGAQRPRAEAEPSDPVPEVPVATETLNPAAEAPSRRSPSGALWRRGRLELQGLLLPLTRSPDAALAVYGSGPKRVQVSDEPPWLRRDEVDWAGLDWRVIEEQLGPYGSISMAPRSFAPRAQLPRRPIELRLEERDELLSAERTLPSAPPEAFYSDDSLDMDDAFAEYDEPVSDEVLRQDPALVEMTDAYSALEMSLEASPLAAEPDEFSDRDGMFEDSLAPRVSAHLEAELVEDLDETGSLDELLAGNPLEGPEDFEFDFGEDDPLVWTEGSPTPLFSDEPTPSPVFRRGRRAAQGAPEAAEESGANEGQRTGVFGRLFNKS